MFLQMIPATFAHMKCVDYAGHLWIRDGDTWRNPQTGITRDHPKWTTREAYQ